MKENHFSIWASLAIILCVFSVTGCKSPLERSLEQQMRERLVLSQQAYKNALADAPAIIKVERPESEVDDFLHKRKLPEGTSLEIADQISSPKLYADRILFLGKDLQGKGNDVTLIEERYTHLIAINDVSKVASKSIEDIRIDPKGVNGELSDKDKNDIKKIETETAEKIKAIQSKIDEIDKKITANQTPVVRMTLQQAIELSVRNNLDIKVAQLIPAIAGTQITQAEAVFDTTFFTTFDFQKTDTPQPPTAAAALAVFGSVQSDDRRLQTGLRKATTTGGQVSVGTEFGRQRRQPSFFASPTFYDANVFLSISQPLLRNFGSDVTRAQILLSQNAREESAQDLRERMLQIVATTEQVYWQLVLAQYRLKVQTRLYLRTKTLGRVIKVRLGFDGRGDEVADVLSRQERYRADLLRSQQAVRSASDALKQLIRTTNLPLSDETVVVPLETPADLSIEFSLAGAITTALQKRPEMRRALLEINDSSIRQRVADNQRLPILDASFTTRLNGVGLGNTGNAYAGVDDADFINYILNLNFEVPLGNRGPEAAFEQRKLERQASVLVYQRTAQEVVREVKDAARTLETSYKIIGASRASRRAAATRVRILTFENKIKDGGADLRLRAIETMAIASIEEMRSLTAYNNSITKYYQAMGTLLERNGIEFNDAWPK